MAGIKAFKKVASADENTSKLQDRLDEFFAPLTSNPLLDGLLLNNVQVGTSATQISHNLRRAPIGWIVVNKSANANVWQANRELEGAFLTLQASAPVTVSIWIF